MVSGESKVWAFLAYLLSIIGFVIVLLAKRKDSFAMYHAKQSLVLFIAAIIVAIIGSIFNFIPILGPLISVVLRILIIVLWIIGMVNSIQGKEKVLPLIGSYGQKINL